MLSSYHYFTMFITCNVSDPSIVLEEIEFETVDTVEDNAAVYQGTVVPKFCVGI